MEKLKLVRFTKNLMDSAKDTTVNSILTLVNEGKIQIDRNSLTKLISIVNNSIDESFQKGSRSLEREIDSLIKNSTDTKKNWTGGIG